MAMESSHAIPEREKRGFVDYMNSLLADDADLKGVVPIDPSSGQIFDASKNGILLAKLVDLTVPGTIDWKRVKKTNISTFNQTENAAVAIQGARDLGCKITNIGPEDITSGKPHLILGIIWQVIKMGLVKNMQRVLDQAAAKKQQAAAAQAQSQAAGQAAGSGAAKTDSQAGAGQGAGASSAPKQTATSPGTSKEHENDNHLEILLSWVNDRIKSVGCKRTAKNLTSDITDSEIYTYLLHALSPTKCDLKALMESDQERRAELVLDNARKLRCDKFVLPKDIVSGNSKLNFAFVANLFGNAPDISDKKQLSSTPRGPAEISGSASSDVGVSASTKASGSNSNVAAGISGAGSGAGAGTGAGGASTRDISISSTTSSQTTTSKSGFQHHECETIILRLTKENEQLKKELEDLRGQHSKLTGEHSKLTGEHSKLTGEHSKLASEHSKLANAPPSPHPGDWDREKKELERKLKEAHDSKAELEKTVKDHEILKNRILELESGSSMSRGLQNELSELKQKYEDAEEEKKQLKQRERELNSKLGDSEVNAEELRALKESLDTQERTNEKLKRSLEDQEKKLSQLKNEEQQEYDKLRKDMKQREQEVEELRDQLKGVEHSASEKRELEETLQQYEQQARELETTIKLKNGEDYIRIKAESAKQDLYLPIQLHEAKAGALKQGFLEKRGNAFRGAWKKRYFVLKDNYLLYYTSQKDSTKRAKFIKLNGANCDVVQEKNKKRSVFFVRSPLVKAPKKDSLPYRTYEMKAKDEAEMNDWIKAVKAQIDFLKTEAENAGKITQRLSMFVRSPAQLQGGGSPAAAPKNVYSPPSASPKPSYNEPSVEKKVAIQYQEQSESESQSQSKSQSPEQSESESSSSQSEPSETSESRSQSSQSS